MEAKTPVFSEKLRRDWTLSDVQALYQQPFADLMHHAALSHRRYFDANTVQVSTLLSIKTGACPEDCSYCSQSGHYKTAIEKEKLMSVENVSARAQQAKANGATRFCMGAAWRTPPKKAMQDLVTMIKEVKALGLEACLTAGMLDDEQVTLLRDAGLDYYNHNLDTSAEFYDNVVSTRSYQERLDTIERVRNSGIGVCCGGILGLGETLDDRLNLLITLANMPEHPGSVPINKLVAIEGTPLAKQAPVDDLDLVRMIAVARIMMPATYLRLSAGRNSLSEAAQALCFLAGANSIFYGEKLLTTPLPDTHADKQLFAKLGITPEALPAAQAPACGKVTEPSDACV